MNRNPKKTLNNRNFFKEKSRLADGFFCTYSQNSLNILSKKCLLYIKFMVLIFIHCRNCIIFAASTERRYGTVVSPHIESGEGYNTVKLLYTNLYKARLYPLDHVTRPWSGSLKYMFRDGVWQLGTPVLKT